MNAGDDDSNTVVPTITQGQIPSARAGLDTGFAFFRRCIRADVPNGAGGSGHFSSTDLPAVQDSSVRVDHCNAPRQSLLQSHGANACVTENEPEAEYGTV